MKIPSCLLRYLFTFQMTPKTIKYVDQKKQDNFSCKHENTLKSMEFSEGDEYLCLLTDGGMARPGIESISGGPRGRVVKSAVS